MAEISKLYEPFFADMFERLRGEIADLMLGKAKSIDEYEEYRTDAEIKDWKTVAENTRELLSDRQNQRQLDSWLGFLDRFDRSLGLMQRRGNLNPLLQKRKYADVLRELIGFSVFGINEANKTIEYDYIDHHLLLEETKNWIRDRVKVPYGQGSI